MVVTAVGGDLTVLCHSQLDLPPGCIVRRIPGSTYRENNRLLLVGTDDDVDNLAGFVAFEANHLEPKERRRQRRLDAMLGKLEAALETLG